MVNDSASVLPHVLETYQREILDDWMQQQRMLGGRVGILSDADLHAQSAEFLSLLQQASAGNTSDVSAPPFAKVRGFLTELSRSRGQAGYTPTETAGFVLSLKRPLFDRLRYENQSNVDRMAADTLVATELLDRLALVTTEAYQTGREEVILRQQQDMLELSTPVVKLWDGILALPMIGTLDSARTQVVMESLLQRIVESSAEIAIIDITGVPTVDTLTAQYLLKTVTAARLMGADCVISGIRPQIAQTIVHLGVDLADIVTKATLADALKYALRQVGLTIARVPARV